MDFAQFFSGRCAMNPVLTGLLHLLCYGVPVPAEWKLLLLLLLLIMIGLRFANDKAVLAKDFRAVF